ncbi:MAG: hypothetical protein ACRCS9_08805 [Hyphomicrobium sp.]
MKVAKGLLGGGGETKALARAQAAQRAQTDAESRRLSAVEAGQKRLRSGGSSLTAYIEDQLKSTFGG